MASAGFGTKINSGSSEDHQIELCCGIAALHDTSLATAHCRARSLRTATDYFWLQDNSMF